jgi:hypothetical protein
LTAAGADLQTGNNELVDHSVGICIVWRTVKLMPAAAAAAAAAALQVDA